MGVLWGFTAYFKGKFLTIQFNLNVEGEMSRNEKAGPCLQCGRRCITAYCSACAPSLTKEKIARDESGRYNPTDRRWNGQYMSKDRGNLK